jgi:hypothetical protein
LIAMPRKQVKEKTVMEATIDGYKMIGHGIASSVKMVGKGFKWLKKRKE